MSPSEIHQHVVVLWRTDKRRIRFIWVKERWGVAQSEWQGATDAATTASSKEFNSSSEALTATMDKLISNDMSLPYETEVQVCRGYYNNPTHYNMIQRILL